MQRRIMTVGLITAVVALILFGIPLAFAVRQVYAADEQSNLEREALRAVVAVDPHFRTGDPVELPATDSSTDLALYDSKGQLVAGTGPSQADAAVTSALAGKVTKTQTAGSLVHAVPVSSHERVIGAIRASTKASTVWIRVLLTWMGMAALAVMAMGVAVLVGRRQSRALAQPLVDLAAAAEQLGEGNFAVTMESVGIPEIDKVGQALNVTSGRLDDLVTRERAFAENASHQLRTPLTGLRLRLETALADPAVDLRSAAAEAMASADRLEQTIDDLLMLARPQSLGPSAAVMATPLAMDGVRERWHGALAEQGRRLHLIRDQDAPDAQASAEAVRQILDVLVDNAFQHGHGTVTVHARDAGGTLAVDVSDEGPGIASEAGDVFSRGVSTTGGQGIGLPLAEGLARDQGGRLLLSERDRITRFTLLLPGAVVQAPPNTG